MNVSMKEQTDTLVVAKGVGEGGMDWEFGIIFSKHVIF